MKGGFYQLHDLIKLTSVPKTTLLRWEREGKFPAGQRDAHGWRIYTKEDVDQITRFIESQRLPQSLHSETAAKYTSADPGKELRVFSKNSFSEKPLPQKSIHEGAFLSPSKTPLQLEARENVSAGLLASLPVRLAIVAAISAGSILFASASYNDAMNARGTNDIASASLHNSISRPSELSDVVFLLSDQVAATSLVGAGKLFGFTLDAFEIASEFVLSLYEAGERIVKTPADILLTVSGVDIALPRVDVIAPAGISFSEARNQNHLAAEVPDNALVSPEAKESPSPAPSIPAREVIREIIRNPDSEAVNRKLSLLNSQFSSLDTRLNRAFSEIADISLRASVPATRLDAHQQMITLTQKIDELDEITVTNGMTIESGSLTISNGSLTVSSNLTVSNDLTVSGSATFSSTSVGVSTAGYFTATSTTATSTFAGGLTIEGTGFVYDFTTNRVGIGTSSPSATFAVSGDVLISGNITSASSITSTSTVQAEKFIATGSTATSTFAGGVTFQTGGFVFDSTTGYIGLGTTSPSQKLTISGNIFHSGGQLIHASSSTTTVPNAINSWSIATSTSATPIFSIDSGTEWGVGIGIANPGNIGLRGGNLDIRGRDGGGIILGTNDGVTAAEEAYLYTSSDTLIIQTQASVGTPIIFNLGGGAEEARFGADGKFGIGTSSPGAMLSVSAATTVPAFLLNQTSTGDLLTLQDSGTTRFQVLDGGNVIVNTGNLGIGTTSPGTVNGAVGFGSLHVAGANSRLILDGTDDAGIWFNDSGATAGQRVWRMLVDGGTYSLSTLTDVGGSPSSRLNITNDGSTVTFTSTASSLSANFSNSTSANGFLQYNGNDWRIFANSGSVPTLNITGGAPGNVGIGETSPGSRLSVSGNATIGASYDTTAAPANGLLIEGATGLGTTSPGGFLSISVSTTSPAFILNQTSTGDLFTLQDNGSTVFVVRDGGNIGHGTSTPWGKLSVEMDTTNPSFVVSNQGSTTPAFYIGGVNQDGRIGIGTSSPIEKLTLTGGSILQAGGDSVNNYTLREIGGTDLGQDLAERATDNNIAIAGKYAYVGLDTNAANVAGACSTSDATGCELRIFDVSTSTPSHVSGIDVGGSVYSAVVSGNLLYLGMSASTTEREFLIYDVSNPSYPRRLGGVELGAYVSSIAISGRYAYIIDSQLKIIDISDPKNPFIIASPSSGGGISIYKTGRYVYLTTDAQSGNEFQIWDVSDPKNPVVVGGIETGGMTQDVFANGQYAFVGKHTTGIAEEFIIYDISDPANPATTSALSIDLSVNGIFVSGRYAYVSTLSADTNGLRVYDIADPRNPVLVGGAQDDAGFGDIVIQGKRLYVGTASGVGNEFIIYELTGIEAQSLLAHSFEAGQVQVRNDLTAAGGLFSNSLNVGLGGISAFGHLSVNASSTATTTTNTVASFLGGYVGIGTTTPFSTLQIASTTRTFFTITDAGAGSNLKHWNLASMGGNFYLATSSDAYATSSASALTINSNSVVSISNALGVGTTTPGGLLAVAGGSAYPAFLLDQTSTGDLISLLDSGTSRFVVKDGGKVGISTSSPVFKFDIDNAGNNEIGLRIVGSGLGASLRIASAGTGGRTYDISAEDSGSGCTGCLVISGSNARLLTLSPTAVPSVGINDETPDAVLELSGNGSADKLFMVSSNASTDGDYFLVGTSGRVGIGTTTPGTSSLGTERLNVLIGDNSPAALFQNTNTGTTVNSGTTITLVNRNASANTVMGLGFAHANSVSAYPQAAIIEAGLSNVTSGAEDGFLRFITISGASLGERARFTPAGNFAIGTTTANQKLSIFNNAADPAIEFSSASGDTYKWVMGMDYSDGGKFKISSSTALGTNDRLTIDGAGNMRQTAAVQNISYPNVGGTAGQLHLIPSGSGEDRTMALTFGTLGAGIEATAGIYVSGNSGAGTTMYFATTDSWASGQARMSISPSGLVAIGNATAAGQFHASSTSNVVGVFDQRGFNDILQARDAGSTVFVIKDGGSVGVGTTSPGGLLSVSVATTVPAFLLNQTSTGDLFTLQDNGSTVFVVRDGGNIGYGTSTPWGKLSVEMDTANPSFVVSNSGSSTPAFYIGGVNQDGYIGVGTSTPAEKLTLSGGSIFQAGGDAVNNYTLKEIGSGAEIGVSVDIGGGNPLIVSGNYTYVITNSAISGTCSSSDPTGCELRIYDISTSTPSLIGGVELGGAGGREVAVANGLAFVGTSASSTGPELLIYDVSNPRNPLLISSLETAGGQARALYVSGRYLYVGTDAGFFIIDIADPRNPYIRGTYAGQTTAVTVAGKYAYVGINATESFVILDVSNPANPVKVGSMVLGEFPDSIDVSGSYAYVTKRNAGVIEDFIIYNISDPASIATTSAMDIAIETPQVHVSGRYAYMGSRIVSGNELRVFDVFDPYNIVTVGGVELGVHVVGMSVVGKRIYIGTSNNTTGPELRIFEITGIEAQSVLAHSLEAGNAQIRDNLLVGQGLYSSALNVGYGGIQSFGALSVTAATTTATGTPIATFLGGYVGIGTSTPAWSLQVASSTQTYFTITDAGAGSNLKHWTMSSQGGNFYIATSSDVYATSSASFLSVDSNGVAAINGRLAIGGPMLGTGMLMLYNAAENAVQFRDEVGMKGMLGVSGSDGQVSNNALADDFTVRATAQLHFTAGGANTRMMITRNGAVGIGTTSPTGFLGVSAATTSPAFLLDQTSTGDLISLLDSGTSRFIVKDGGNVGVGTSTPGGRFSVQALSNVNAPLFLLNQQSDGGGGASPLMVLQNMGNTLFQVTANNAGGGRVGIGAGTSSPVAALAVSTNSNEPAVIIQQNGGTGVPLTVQNGNAEIFKVTQAGNVALGGTTTPAAMLAISQGNNAPGFILNQSGTGVPFTINVNAAEVFKVMQSDGSVAISGTTTPAGLLSIQNIGSNKPGIIIQNTSGGAPIVVNVNAAEVFKVTQAGNVTLDGNLGVGSTTPNWKLSVAGDAVVWNGGTQADLKAYNGAICSDNNGTTKCQAALTAGTVYGDASSFAASDVAENYPVYDESIEAGDIVAIGTAKVLAQSEDKKVLKGKMTESEFDELSSSALLDSAALVKADASNKSRVIGIVSTAPGVLLGDTTGMTLNTETRPVALVGRVPLKVSSEGGPIEIGDRITLSSIPGVGMKATSSGLTIGLVLESFDEANALSRTLPDGTLVKTGSVLVFVNLAQADLDKGVTQIAQGETNAWSVDQSTGKVNVNFYGDVDLHGNNLLGVNQIVSQNGLWKIDENGKMTMRYVEAEEIKTNKLIVGSETQPTGITVFDKNGKPGCVSIDDVDSGQIKLAAGICNILPLSSGSSAASPEPVQPLESATTTAPAVTSEAAAPTETATDSTSSLEATTPVIIENQTSSATELESNSSSTTPSVSLPSETATSTPVTS